MVGKRRVTVVVDSSCCLPINLQKDSGIVIVPHRLIVNGRAYRDGIDMHADEFYRLQKIETTKTTTSGPTIKDFQDVFQRACESGKDVLCLTLPSKFSSATTDAASIAMQTVKQQFPTLRIQIIDSQASAGAEGLIALETARSAIRGAELEELIHITNQMIPKVHLIAFLDTLTYLKRSGRITKAKAWAGSILGIKPLAELSLGNARLISKPRSRAKAIEQLLSIAQERMGTLSINVNVMHANSLDDATQLYHKVKLVLDCHEIFVSEFTPVMGSHTGPGVLGLAFYPND